MVENLNIDIDSIIQDVEKCTRCVKTDLLIPDTVGLLRILGARYSRKVKPDEGSAIFQDLKALADKNDAQATYELGLCHYLSFGVEFNVKEAARLFRSAAERKHGDAINALGVCYMEGRGVDYSPEKAVKMFKLGASFKNPVCVYNLGLTYFNGLYEDDETAVDRGIKLIRQAAQLGLTDAINELGRICSQGGLDGEPEDRAVKYFIEAAKRGSGEGLFNLGIAHTQGDGVPKDMTKAFDCFRRAYDAGFVRAFFVLAQFYRGGTVAPANEEAARAVIREAAELNDPRAIGAYASSEALASRLRPEEAFNLLIKGAHYGSEICALELGDLLDGGVFGEESKPLAVRYWALASYNGSGDASVKLAQCYFDGRVVPQDADKGLELLKRGVKQDSATACLLLGELFLKFADDAPPEEGWKLRAHAAQLFTQGAEDDDVHCLQALATCYKKGIGVDKNETRAKMLKKKAKEIAREEAREKGGGGFFGWIKRIFGR